MDGLVDVSTFPHYKQLSRRPFEHFFKGLILSLFQAQRGEALSQIKATITVFEAISEAAADILKDSLNFVLL